MEQTARRDAAPQSAMAAARLRKGLTLRQLADACREAGTSVDHGQLGRIERGEASPRPGLRATLAEVLGIDPVTDLPS